MVILWIFLSFLWTSPILAQVVVEASINDYQGIANHAINGSITITHPQDEKVDTESFKLDGQPLSVTFVRQVPISGETVISIYSFELAAKQEGLYILPAISVKVGQSTYHSFSSSYEIKASRSTTAAPATSLPSSASSPPLFKLEAFIQGPSPLYPGQRAKLVYRISFNRSVDLTYSELPLIHTTEFKKIGDEQVKEYQKGDVTIQEITQEIETARPGTFHYSPSIIEGYAYQTSFGQKMYLKDKLKAEAPAIDVVVNEFPEQSTPQSFTGAIGSIQGDLKMITPSTIRLGDRIELQLTVSGPSNLAEMALPELKCQPGFSGFFQLSDLPPIANLEGSRKVFQIEMRPISTFVQAVPSIELSSFEPNQGKYSIWQSQPIPLSISASPSERPAEAIPEKPLILAPLFPSLIQRINISLAPLEEPKAILLNSKALQSPGLNPLWLLWMLLLGGALILLQNKWHTQWQERQPPIQASKQKLKAALSAKAHNPQLLRLLSDALISRLKETGYWKDSPEDLPPGDMRSFLIRIDSLRYGTAQSFNPSQLKKETQKLFDSIAPNSKG